MAKPLKTPAPRTHMKRQSDDMLMKLAESEALFSSIGEGVIVTDVNGKISRINAKAQRILGFTSDEVLGRWFPSVIVSVDEHGSVIPNNRRPTFEIFITGEPIFRRIYYVKKDGSRVAVAVTASPVMMNNRPIGAVEVFRDITEELKLERAKDEFIALASHQLRTPATAVKQYAAMLRDGYAGVVTPAQYLMIEKIFQSNERQINTINDLLRIAQIDAGRLQLDVTEVDLNSLLMDVVSEHTHKFQSRSQRINLKLPPQSITTSVDKGRFRMAIENLIDNASKYTPDGKSIQVKLGRQKGQITIEIRDEGVGIPKEDYARIFEKFSRIDNPLSISVGGTGLGLYWVQKILDLHGAKIRVRSKMGEGTVFTIHLGD